LRQILSGPGVEPDFGSLANIHHLEISMKRSEVSKPVIRFQSLEGVEDVRLVTGKGVAGSFPPHVHVSLCLGIVDRGVRSIETAESGNVLVHPGHIFVLNPGQAHACTCGGSDGALNGHDYRVLSLGPRMGTQDLSHGKGFGSNLPPFGGIVFSDAVLVRAMNALFATSAEAKKRVDHERILREILERLSALHAEIAPNISRPVPPDREILARVRQYLDSHSDEQVALEDLAEVAGLSRFHLQRQFSRHIGVSPKNYLLHRRSANAARLLEQGMEPARVAAFTGFADQSHLTKTFKRFVGTTPARFRALHARPAGNTVR
jgi:AraC-like DNA-binding protein